MVKHVSNMVLPPEPNSRVSATGSGACTERACFSITQNNSPGRVGNLIQRAARTEPREVAILVLACRSAGMWPGNSQITVHGGGLCDHARLADRVAPDVRGLRRTHPPPCTPRNAGLSRKNRI